MEQEGNMQYPEIVIASEAKQSRAGVNRPGLLRFARNDEV
jgi:hypothetical protein